MDESRPPGRPTDGTEPRPPLPRRTALQVAAGALSTSMAGCLGTGFLSDEPAELSEQWTSKRTTEYGQNHHQFAAVDEGLNEPIIVAPQSSLTGGTDCGITAIDATGTLAWHEPIDPAYCTPHAVGDIGVGTREGETEVFAGTESGDIVGFTAATGAETLRTDALDSIGYSAPVVGEFTGTGPEVIAADFEGRVVAIDMDSEIVWSHDLDTRTSITPILEDITGDGKLDLAIAHGRRSDSAVSVFSPNGETVWTEAVDGTPRSFTSLEDGSERLLAVGTRKTASCIEGTTGETRWTVSFDETVSVGGNYDDQLLVGTNDGVIRALNVADGTVDWKRSLAESGETKLTAPVVSNSKADGTTIAAATYSGRVVLLDSVGDIFADYHHDEGIYVSPQFVDLTGDGADDLLGMDGYSRLIALENQETNDTN